MVYRKLNARKTKAPRKMYRKKKLPLKKYIQRVIRQGKENKSIDISASDTSLINTDSTSLNNCVNPVISQGDGDETRDGDKIYLKGVKLNHTLSTTVSASIRQILILVDGVRDANQTSNITTDWSSLGLNGHLPKQTLGYKYKVLFDRRLNIDPDNRGHLSKSEYIPLKVFRDYNGTDTTYHTNKLFLWTFTDNTTASAINMSINGRMYFKDY